MTIPLVLVGGFLAFALVVLLITIIQYPPTIAVLVIREPHYVLLLAALYVFEVVLFRYIIRGYACDYTANRVEFCITRKGRTVMNILYKDAVSVEYRPMKFLWAEQGFHVTIKMKSYSLFFDYVVPRAMRFHTDNFPFEIINREIVRREIGEENAV
ncbi:MAG: hypothetical protein J1F04_07055 [Oscillospiraceae bacterium]|nr:hypothetical protein [Oscillospiraceae bacterium]